MSTVSLTGFPDNNFLLSDSLSFPSLCIICVCASDAIYGGVAPPAVEGEYYPWARELQQGLWLQRLSNEEDTGTFKGTLVPSPLSFALRRV